MADLTDASSDELPPERRLRLSIKWRSIKAPSYLPGETFAQFGIGFFLGDAPLYADAVYGDAQDREKQGLQPGYFIGYDTDCELLTGLKKLVDGGERLDFEDETEPLFRLIIAPDIFDPGYSASADTDYFNVLGVIYWGGAWHGQALPEQGPAIKLSATREALRQFLRDLVSEAFEPGICEPEACLIMKKRFSDVL